MVACTTSPPTSSIACSIGFIFINTCCPRSYAIYTESFFWHFLLWFSSLLGLLLALNHRHGRSLGARLLFLAFFSAADLAEGICVLSDLTFLHLPFGSVPLAGLQDPGSGMHMASLLRQPGIHLSFKRGVLFRRRIYFGFLRHQMREETTPHGE